MDIKPLTPVPVVKPARKVEPDEKERPPADKRNKKEPADDDDGGNGIDTYA